MSLQGLQGGGKTYSPYEPAPVTPIPTRTPTPTTSTTPDDLASWVRDLMRFARSVGNVHQELQQVARQQQGKKITIDLGFGPMTFDLMNPYDRATLSDIIKIAGDLGVLGTGEQEAAGAGPQVTMLTPPILDILEALRSSRDAQANRAIALAGLLASTLPENLTYYPGFEPGGLADIALGIATGHGVQRAGAIIPEAQRRVQRRNIMPPPVEPPFLQDWAAAEEFANRLLDQLRTYVLG